MSRGKSRMNQNDLTYVGPLHTWRNRKGELVTRDDAGPRVAGDDMEGDEVEGDEVEGDDMEGEVDALGDRLDRLERRLEHSENRQGKRNRRMDKRQDRMNTRMDKRQDRLRRRIGNRSEGESMEPYANWHDTVESGEASNITAPGQAATIKVRIENWDAFKINDISFEGSSDTGARVKTVWIAGTPAWNSDTGVPITLFGPTSTLRSILKNTPALRGGLQVKFDLVSGSGSTEAPKNVIVTMFGKGYKKKLAYCQ